MLDNLDRHLAASGSLDTAAIPMGLYFAWCANLGLLNESFEEAHGAILVRLRMRDMGCSESFVVLCGGELSESCLNDRGREFSRRYYGRYLEELQTRLGNIYKLADQWHAYDQIAPVLTRALMGDATGQDGRRESIQNRVAGSFRRFWKRRLG